MINNLDVYPNPTRDIFNVSFVSEEIQTLSIRVLNIVGEVIYEESLEEFIGEYTKQINLEDCLLYTSPSPRDRTRSRMPSSA